ncbi:MAG TPA: hypothetical protein VFJ85_07765 [Acidimicrobiales bacterium]|nr:hypothetical protein [Acidimicrobiales bacterium]
MERKRAVIAAGAVSGTLFAVTSAVSLHQLVLSLPPDGGAGALRPVTGAAVEQQTALAAPEAPAVAPPTAQALTTSGASTVARLGLGDSHSGADGREGGAGDRDDG